MEERVGHYSTSCPLDPLFWFWNGCQAMWHTENPKILLDSHKGPLGNVKALLREGSGSFYIPENIKNCGKGVQQTHCTALDLQSVESALDLKWWLYISFSLISLSLSLFSNPLFLKYIISQTKKIPVKCLNLSGCCFKNCQVPYSTLIF